GAGGRCRCRRRAGGRTRRGARSRRGRRCGTGTTRRGGRRGVWGWSCRLPHQVRGVGHGWQPGAGDGAELHVGPHAAAGWAVVDGVGDELRVLAVGAGAVVLAGRGAAVPAALRQGHVAGGVVGHGLVFQVAAPEVLVGHWYAFQFVGSRVPPTRNTSSTDRNIVASRT